MAGHAEQMDSQMDVPDNWEDRVEEEAVGKPEKAVGDDPEGESKKDKEVVEKGGDEPKMVVSKAQSAEERPEGNPEEGACMKVLLALSEETPSVKPKGPSRQVSSAQKAGKGAGKTSTPISKPTKRSKPWSKSNLINWGKVQCDIRLKKHCKPTLNVTTQVTPK